MSKNDGHTSILQLCQLRVIGAQIAAVTLKFAITKHNCVYPCVFQAASSSVSEEKKTLEKCTAHNNIRI
jgi:hypothetical protein